MKQVRPGFILKLITLHNGKTGTILFPGTYFYLIMNKLSLIVTCLILFICCSLTASAQSVKTIMLKDGSVLKGQVIDLTDNVYTIQTAHLGNIQIAESEILSITAADHNPQNTVAADDAHKEDLKQQVQEMQGSIMMDGDILMDISELTNDEEIKAILSNPNLLKEVMSYDQTTIEQSDGVQQLLNNPKMQQLMEKIKAKYPQQ